MKFLKNLALSILSLLLFLSLSTFGLAFTVDRTVLNPKFVATELDGLILATPSLLEETLNKMPSYYDPLTKEFQLSLVNTFAEAEPLIKEQIDTAVYATYDYLLGRDQDLDLARIIKDTFLSRDFVVSIVDKIDLSLLIKEYIMEELYGQTQDIGTYFDEAIAKTATELDPWINEQVSAAVDPVSNYLLGKSQTLNMVIFLGTPKEILKANLEEAFFSSPPPELAGASQPELQQYLDHFYEELSLQLPNLEFTASSLAEPRVDFLNVLAEAESALVQAKQYVGYFQLIYKASIALMLLSIVGIIFLIKEVKAVSRTLGTTFLTYGAFEFAGIFIMKYFAEMQIPTLQIPSLLETWVLQFMGDLLAPLQMFSLGCIIGGIILIVVSFVYRPRQSSEMTI